MFEQIPFNSTPIKEEIETLAKKIEQMSSRAGALTLALLPEDMALPVFKRLMEKLR